MSPKANSTALAVILALCASPVLAQATTEESPAATSNDSAPATDTPPASDAATTEPTGSEASAAEPAESDAAEAEAAPAEATPDAEAAAEDAPAADATPAEPPVGAYYPRATHGDWSLRCIKTADGADPCELYQLMKDGEGNSVAEITLIPLDNGGEAKAGATIVTPLETDLTQGIRLQIDSGQAKAYPFNFCAPVGCVSRVGLTDAEINSLKRGNTGSVSLLPYGAGADQVVSLPLSLTGFTAGYTELEAAVAEMRAAAEAAPAPAADDAAAAAPADAAPAETEAAPAQ